MANVFSHDGLLISAGQVYDAQGNVASVEGGRVVFNRDVSSDEAKRISAFVDEAAAAPEN